MNIALPSNHWSTSWIVSLLIVSVSSFRRDLMRGLENDVNHSLTKNILRIFFHFVIIPLMLPALLIFLTYMLTCYSFAHLLICLAEHITTLSSFLLLSKIQYLKNLYVKQSIESFSISLFLASEDLPAHLRCYSHVSQFWSLLYYCLVILSSSEFRPVRNRIDDHPLIDLPVDIIEPLTPTLVDTLRIYPSTLLKYHFLICIIFNYVNCPCRCKATMHMPSV